MISSVRLTQSERQGGTEQRRAGHPNATFLRVRVARLLHQVLIRKALLSVRRAAPHARTPGSPVFWNHLCPCRRETLKWMPTPGSKVGVCRWSAAMCDAQYSRATCCLGHLQEDLCFPAAWSPPRVLPWAGFFRGRDGTEKAVALLASGSSVGNRGRIPKRDRHQPPLPERS